MVYVERDQNKSKTVLFLLSVLVFSVIRFLAILQVKAGKAVIKELYTIR